MNKLYFWRCAFALAFLGLLAQPARSQRLVKLASQLDEVSNYVGKFATARIDTLRPARLVSLSDNCRKYFQLLYLNPLPIPSSQDTINTPAELEAAYQGNELIHPKLVAVLEVWKYVAKKQAGRELANAQAVAAAKLTELLSRQLLKLAQSNSLDDSTRLMGYYERRTGKLITDTDRRPLAALRADTASIVTAAQPYFIASFVTLSDAQIRGLDAADDLLGYLKKDESDVAGTLTTLLTAQTTAYNSSRPRAVNVALDKTTATQLRIASGQYRLDGTEVVGTPSGAALLPMQANSRLDAGATRPGTSSLEVSVVDGTAKFLADRFKRELNATFFQRFAVILRDTTYIELRYLFPATARLLASGSADYSTLVQTLRGTFEHDLQDLFFNYGEMLRLEPRYRRRLLGDGDANQAMALRYSFLATKVTYHLSRGVHPIDLRGRLQQDMEAVGLLPPNNDKLLTPYAKQWSQQTQTVLDLLGIVSDGVLNEGTNRNFLPADTILKKLAKYPQVRNLYVGLVWQRLRATKLPINPARVEPLLFEFANLSGEMQRQAYRLRRRADSTRLRMEDFVPLYLSAQRGIEFALRNAVAAERRECVMAQFDRSQHMGDALLQGYLAADRGDYGVTLSSFLELVLLATSAVATPAGTACAPALVKLPNKVNSLLRPEERAVAQAPAHSVESALPATGLTVLPSASVPTPATFISLAQVVRYGSFMAAVVQAKNSDQVKEALEAAALPVGSSSIKRRSFRSLSVNSFVGVTGGAEYAYLEGGPLTTLNKWKPNVGPTASLGLAMSWGQRGNAQWLRLRSVGCNSTRLWGRRMSHLDQLPRYYDSYGRDSYLRGGSWSVFLSIADLGVPVLFRLNDANANVLPRNIDFRHVLAPGLFAVYGFPRSPMSAFAGVQFTPQLRQLTDLDTTQAATVASGSGDTFRSSLRFNVGLTVDIPIFQLGTRTEPRWTTPGRTRVSHQSRRDSLEVAVFFALRQVVEGVEKNPAPISRSLLNALRLVSVRYHPDQKKGPNPWANPALLKHWSRPKWGEDGLVKHLKAAQLITERQAVHLADSLRKALRTANDAARKEAGSPKSLTDSPALAATRKLSMAADTAESEIIAISRNMRLLYPDDDATPDKAAATGGPAAPANAPVPGSPAAPDKTPSPGDTPGKGQVILSKQLDERAEHLRKVLKTLSHKLADLYFEYR